MIEVIQNRMNIINSRIENIKKETPIDFTIDISEGIPYIHPEIFTFNFRYKPYTFIAILPDYSNGIPWTNIFNGAITKIIEMENLKVTITERWRCKGDRVNSTTDTFALDKRKDMEDYEVNEILGCGGFNRTYYVTHNINDIDYKTLLDGFDDKVEGEWIKVENLVTLQEAVKNYIDPKSIFINKIEDLKIQFAESIQPMIREFGDKFKLVIDEYSNSAGYKIGDIVETMYDEFYLIEEVSDSFIDMNKITFTHNFPKTYASFGNSKKITKKDLYAINFYGKKINKSGSLSLKNTIIFNSYIKEKVGEIKDYKTPKEIKKLMNK